MPFACEGQKRALDFLEQKLQMEVSHHADTSDVVSLDSRLVWLGLVFFLKQGLAMQLWLLLYSLFIKDWPQTFSNLSASAPQLTGL